MLNCFVAEQVRGNEWEPAEIRPLNWKAWWWWKFSVIELWKTELLKRLSPLMTTCLGLRHTFENRLVARFLNDSSCYLHVYRLHLGCLGSWVVSVLDSGAEGPGFNLQSRRCRVTVLGKLFTPIVHQAAKFSSPVKGCGSNWQSNGRPAGFMTYVACQVTAKNRDQLRSPTLEYGLSF